MFTDNIIQSTMFQVRLCSKANRSYALLNAKSNGSNYSILCGLARFWLKQSATH